jgi:hypothetical protein
MGRIRRRICRRIGRPGRQGRGRKRDRARHRELGRGVHFQLVFANFLAVAEPLLTNRTQDWLEFRREMHDDVGFQMPCVAECHSAGRSPRFRDPIAWLATFLEMQVPDVVETLHLCFERPLTLEPEATHYAAVRVFLRALFRARDSRDVIDRLVVNVDSIFKLRRPVSLVQVLH